MDGPGLPRGEEVGQREVRGGEGMVILEEDSLSLSLSNSKVVGAPNLLRHPVDGVTSLLNNHPADGQVKPSSNLLADGTPSLRDSPLVNGEPNLPKPSLLTMPMMEDGVLIPLLSSLLPLLSLALRLRLHLFLLQLLLRQMTMLAAGVLTMCLLPTPPATIPVAGVHPSLPRGRPRRKLRL